MSYDILKALHLIAIVCWFAGLFYLPRLFVYHVAATGEASEMLKIMERRLYKYIMGPAMVATWLFGLWLVSLEPAWLTSGGWLHAKLLFVVLLSGFHGLCGVYLKKFRDDANQKSEKFYRILNEAPTAALIIIIFLAVLKPF